MGREHKEYAWNLIAKKLSGEATPQELIELESLLRNNPELYYPMQTVADLWKPASPLGRKEAESAFSRHIDRMQDLKIEYVGDPFHNTEVVGSRRISRTKLILFSMAGALSLAAGIFFIQHGKTNDSLTQVSNATASDYAAASEIVTNNGSRTHVVLPDGTMVWLNSGSRIKYDKNFGAGLREINLTGEAFFDVAHNAQTPFVIHTARIDIKVLGTRFNVKSYPSDNTTEATLIRGSIEVSIKDRPSEKIILKPNEKLVVANDDSTLHRTLPGHHAAVKDESLVSICKPTYETNTGAVIETSWVDNKLIFQDEEFGELAIKMERWYGISIHFDNADLEKLQFTGSFQKETVQQALDALKETATTTPFNYRITENQITIYE
ncbi:MAG: FecR domain-containing protein [Bacteroidota bacterium]|nr:FecR domain-containing protein [Bacteroidota bacterium]MDP4246995.1 FecR domain-containing protein [Bacteroidota bacterium]MDP4255111.1 FecR domain-containing protein [Bacteroidota bacterium]MDP4260839.1 FecR domain-containing protein [Bacteroidota bacterium]